MRQFAFGDSRFVSRKPTIKVAVALAPLFLVAGLVSGQSALSHPEDVQTTIRSISSLVVVPAVVRDASGNLMTNLDANDFRLTDNGVEQTVIAEPARGEPIALVIVMQTGGSAPGQFQSYRTLNALVNFLTNREESRVALVTFDSRLEQIWSFPPRVDGLKNAFKNPERGDRGAAILDALIGGIGLLEHQPANYRRVILLLSQAHDDGSEASPLEFLQRLGKSNVTIYSVTFRPGTKVPMPRSNNQHPVRGSRVLQDVSNAMRDNTAEEAAALSGGEHAQLKNKDDLERAVLVLTSDFANSYTLSFHPNSEDPGLHWIDVQVAKKRAHSTVKARAIYWRGETGADK